MPVFRRSGNMRHNYFDSRGPSEKGEDMESHDASDIVISKNLVVMNPLQADNLNNHIMEQKNSEAVIRFVEESEVQIELLEKSGKLQKELLVISDSQANTNAPFQQEERNSLQKSLHTEKPAEVLIFENQKKMTKQWKRHARGDFTDLKEKRTIVSEEGGGKRSRVHLQQTNEVCKKLKKEQNSIFIHDADSGGCYAVPPNNMNCFA